MKRFESVQRRKALERQRGKQSYHDLKEELKIDRESNNHYRAKILIIAMRK